MFADAVNEFKLPPLLSKFVNLVLADELNDVKSIPSIVPVNSIEPETTISFAKTTGVPPTDDCIFCPFNISTGPFNIILPLVGSNNISPSPLDFNSTSPSAVCKIIESVPFSNILID